MLKVTIKFTGPVFFLFILSCTGGQRNKTNVDERHFFDSVSEARIDSAYRSISQSCETLLVHQVPRLLELLKKQDTGLLKKSLDTMALYTDPDKKVEKVIRQLKADCDSNLLQETYKRWRLLQEQAPGPYKKKKV